MPPFTYHRPSTLREALELLAAGDDGTKVLAGGQSLVPAISIGLAFPTQLIDVNRIPDLSYARVNDGTVAVGALTRHSDLEAVPADVAAAAPLVPEAAPLIASRAIRNRGTFAGSLAHADPAAEWPAVALALDAEMDLVSVRGVRTVPAEQFFIGPLETALKPDELLSEVRWPAARPGSVVSVQELTYRYGDFAVVGVATQLRVEESGRIADARIALYGVGPTPLRARAAEQIACDRGSGSFEDAGRAAADISRPTDDETASADYRRRMVTVFVRRALTAAYGKAVDGRGG